MEKIYGKEYLIEIYLNASSARIFFLIKQSRFLFDIAIEIPIVWQLWAMACVVYKI